MTHRNRDDLDESARRMKAAIDNAQGASTGALWAWVRFGEERNAAFVACRRSKVEFGHWYKDQGFGVSTEWARKCGQLAANERALRDWARTEQVEGRVPNVTGAMALVNPKRSVPFATPVANDAFPESERAAFLRAALEPTFASGPRTIRLANAIEDALRRWELQLVDAIAETLAAHVQDWYDRDDLDDIVDELLSVLRGQ